MAPLMSDSHDLTQDRLAATLPVDGRGRPSIGGVSLTRKLGVGGMGAVYLGTQERLGREVAVKILPHNLVERDPRMVERFQAEARMAAGIDSAHVVRVLDVGFEYGTHYYVMEYVEGMSAGALLKQRRAEGKHGLAESEALRVVRGATRGLAAAHAKGVVHRDIKPDNIMIPKGDADAAKLADLGLAKPEGGGQSFGTGTGMAMGTPGFMAPEQAENAKSAGPAADVFSMGATLHALISGDAPFRGSSLVAVLRATEEGKIAPMPEGTGAGVQWLVARCLTARPEERFQNGAELLDALERAMREPRKAGPSAVVPSRPPSPPPRVDAAGPPSLSVPSDPPAPPSRAPVFVAAGIAALMIAALLVYVATRQDPAAKTSSPEPEGMPVAAKPPEEDTSASATAARRREEYQRFMSAAVAVRTVADAQDTEEAWSKALAALADVRANAFTDPELADVTAREAEARARGEWAGAKAAEKGGDLDKAIVRGKKAWSEAHLRGLDAWIAAVEARAGTESAKRAARKRMGELEQEAAKAGDEAAVTLLEEAFRLADEDADRKRVRQALDEAQARITARGQAELEAKLRKEQEARERAEAEAREKEYAGAAAEADAAEKKGDLKAAAAAWRRALEAKAGDARAEGKIAELTERLEAIQPVRKGNRLEVALDGATKMEFVLLPAGEFTSGEDRQRHTVRLTKPFWLQTTEVTQAQWSLLMADNPSAHRGPQMPAEQMDWYDVQEFLWRLNRRLDGWMAALPTEAQWEYACRAGAKTKFMHGDAEPGIEAYAWYQVNAAGTPHDVATLSPNRWGLHDMSGNVAELCHDFFVLQTDFKDAVDPVGPAAGPFLCVRGSAFNGDVSWLRCSLRGQMQPHERMSHIGFRLLLAQGEGVAPHAVRESRFCDTARKVPVEFVEIRPGAYAVGQPGVAGAPHRTVTFKRGFGMATTEITQAQWIAVLGARDFSPAGPDLPATGVSWDDAQRFAKELGKRLNRTVSLPTEAEWEVACRAGAPAKWYSGGEAEDVPQIAWTSGNAGQVRPVAKLRPNALGIYDMSGNAWEWCSDGLAPLGAEPVSDPTGPEEAELRVIRGGAYTGDAEASASASRKGLAPSAKQADVGFRVVLK